MSGKENQRVMLTKKLLKNALVELLQKDSLYHISIRELCEKSGINRSTFYKYYGSQFELLAEMEQDLLNDIERSLVEDNVPNPKVLGQLLEYIEKNLEFVRLLLNSSADPEFAGRLFAMPQIQKMLRQVLSSDLSPTEYEYASSFNIYGAYKMVLIWINKEEREKPEWMADFIIRQLSLKA
ncbi:MAG: TetR/AcrR family transcriptional regulator C-terminal domain-containing protein [Lachnospiraceae bacterium]|nr:TetR/AcrR family transcriptional regulator C-terminal domain-containing protein [Ruminococcus sp.]MCM1276959.1 TetR/AcrR family transcriptional regulator C-terminal domain-containing protein [Lachnospiraceae bacterium]